MIRCHGFQCYSQRQKSGKEQQITIQGSVGLSQEEVEAREEAENNAEADQHKRDVIEASNKLDNEIYQIGSCWMTKTSAPEEVESMEAAIGEAECQGFDDLERIKFASQSLMAAAQKLSQVALGAAAAGQATQDDAPQSDLLAVQMTMSSMLI